MAGCINLAITASKEALVEHTCKACSAKIKTLIAEEKAALEAVQRTPPRAKRTVGQYIEKGHLKRQMPVEDSEDSE